MGISETYPHLPSHDIKCLCSKYSLVVCMNTAWVTFFIYKLREEKGG